MTVLTAYGAQMDRLREGVTAITERLWLNLPYYTDEAVPIWFEQIRPVITGAQTAAVTTHDAYLATYLADDVIGIDPAAAIARGSNVPFETIHRAPFLRTWKQVHDGHPFKEAVRSGADLAGANATEDVQRATLGANSLGLEHRDIQAYRRVVSGSTTCKFCYDAAGQTYSRSDLMPVHPKCDCIVVPIEGRAYINKQGARGIGQRYDRTGQPVTRPTAEEERARKREPAATGDHRQQNVA